MHDATADGHALVWLQLNRPILEVHEKPAAKNKKELVVLVVLMPMILAFHDADADNAVIDSVTFG